MLLSLTPVLNDARAKGYGVAAFNFVDYASLRAMVLAADALKAPVIAQVSVKTVKLWGHAAIASWAKQLASEFPKTPFVLHVDHCSDLTFLKKCVEAGWTSVMYDGSALAFEENLKNTQDVLALATPKGVGVEAELGTIGGVEDDLHVKEGDARLADPVKAIEFCQRAKVAVFAPAIGTAHGVYKGEPKIAWDRLEAIAKGTGIPMALHGGTGLSDEVFLRCIKLGCVKLNISTLIKYAFIDGFVDHHKANPSEYEPVKVLTAQIAVMQTQMRRYIALFGGENKAEGIKA